MKSILCILLLIAISQAKAAPAKPDVLFLLGGQSNMAGNGFSADLPNEYGPYRLSPKNVSIWNDQKKAWEPLTMKQRFGPEIGFGHALAVAWPDHHIGLVKFAKGGTSMDRWATTGDLYPQLIRSFKHARATVPEAKLKAMLWHQGESDSDKEAVAKAYKQKMLNHIAAIRTDTEQADLLFILGQINPAHSFMGRPRFVHSEIVRDAQANLGIENTIMIPTDDLEKNAYVRGAAATTAKDKISQQQDNIHYSAQGQINLGKRFAQAYLSTCNGH